MPAHQIYICYPNERQHPLVSGWLEEVRDAIEGNPEWQDWDVKSWQYDMSCSVNINDVSSVIIAAPGPCILIRNVQQKVVTGLRNKVYGRSVVLVGEPNDSVDLLGLFEHARELHLIGEPMLPRKLVVALLLVGKLERHQMWGGRNKGFMWASEIPKGRGLDEKFHDCVPAIIGDLLTAGLLIFKTSNGKRKYALNPKCRAAIHETLRSFRFPAEVQEILERDYDLESARELDDVFAYYSKES